MSLTTIQKIEQGEKQFNRAGGVIQRIWMGNPKILSADLCLKIMNQYGIGPCEIYFLAKSHNCEIDKEGFAKLVDEQIAKIKRCIQCTE